MGIEDCFLLGQIIKTHGLKGELVANLDTDSPDNYRKLESVFVETNGKLIPFFISAISINSKKAILALVGVKSLEEAETFVGSDLYLPEEALPLLPEGSYYFHDLIGFEFYDGQDLIGTVTQIYELPTHTLIGLDHKGKEVLIPAEPELLGEVDLVKKQIHGDLPTGLLEIYTT